MKWCWPTITLIHETFLENLYLFNMVSYCTVQALNQFTFSSFQIKDQSGSRQKITSVVTKISSGNGNWLALVNTREKAFSSACSVMLDKQPSKPALMVRGWSWKYINGDSRVMSFSDPSIIMACYLTTQYILVVDVH